jgi:hypothetical protein
MGNIFKIKRRNALAGATAFDPTRVNLSQSGGSDNGYKTGDKVMYQGNYYVATANNDAIPPTDGLGVYWSLLGPALGAPATIAHGELAFNEVGEAFYYGKASNASSSIGGKGEFLDKSTAQTLAGNKTFSSTVVLSSAVTVTQVTTAADTYVATTEFVKNVFSVLDGGNFDDAGGGGGGGGAGGGDFIALNHDGNSVYEIELKLPVSSGRPIGTVGFAIQTDLNDGNGWFDTGMLLLLNEYLDGYSIYGGSIFGSINLDTNFKIRVQAMDANSNVLANSNELAYNRTGTTITFISGSATPVTGAYYYSASSNNWYTLSNWWGDSAHTQQATTFPLSSTNVVIVNGSVEPLVSLDNASWVQPASINSGSVGITFTSQNFGNVTCSISGEATFEGNSTYNV